MKKAKNKPRKGKRKGSAAPMATPKPARRSFASMAGTIALAVVVVGGVGFWGVRTVRASVAERDLTRVGTGTPAIVQVHDMQCSTCIALQHEVRAALNDMDEGAPTYLVADLNSDAGSAFAARYGAGHTTLLLFDEDGTLTQQLVGVTSEESLLPTFHSLMDAR